MLFNDSRPFDDFCASLQCEDEFSGVSEADQQAELDAAQAALDEGERANPFDHCDEVTEEESRVWKDTESYYDEERADYEEGCPEFWDWNGDY